DCELPILREGESDALQPLCERHLLSADDEFFPDPLADDRRLFLGRLFGRRRRQRYGESDQYRRIHDTPRKGDQSFFTRLRVMSIVIAPAGGSNDFGRSPISV